MTLISPELKEGVRKLFDWLSSPDYSVKPPSPTTAIATMTGPQSSEAKWPNYMVTSDEPQSIGGKDSAPQPSQIFVASIGFAENVIFARQAAMHNIDFDSLETRVEAQWDRKGLFGIGNADPSITDVSIETRIITTADSTRVAELLNLTNKRCPMTTTVARAAAIRRKLFVNGEEVQL